MIPLQIPQKLDPVLYVWRNSESKGEEDEVIAGLTYDYRSIQVIGGGLLRTGRTWDISTINRTGRFGGHMRRNTY